MSSNDYAGRLIINWPPVGIGLLAELCVLVDANDGEQITSCYRLVIDSHPGNLIAATLTLPVTEDGTPILRGVINAAYVDGELRTGDFRWLVAEMRVDQ